MQALALRTLYIRHAGLKLYLPAIKQTRPFISLLISAESRTMSDKEYSSWYDTNIECIVFPINIQIYEIFKVYNLNNEIGNETHMRKRNQPGNAREMLRKNTCRVQKCSLLQCAGAVLHNTTYRQKLRKLPYKSIFMALQTYFEIQIYITIKFIYSQEYAEIQGAVRGIITP